MEPIKQFELDRKERIKANAKNKNLINAALSFMKESLLARYSYNFSWLGRPIIQYPQDMFAMQEILWEIKPELVVEMGIAHGGSLIFYASILELIGKGEVLGIDIDIRKHNREAIKAHPLFKRITLIEGSSLSPEVTDKVQAHAKGRRPVLVCLDSNHTHEHVARELELYSPLVNPGSYIVIFDTNIEDLPDEYCAERPWGKGNNPKTAVHEFLKTHSEFEIDRNIENKLLATVSPDGYLKRIK